jgi:hypothetical protein
VLARPRSFSVTLRAHALSTGVYLLGLMPFCSLYVFPVWALVLRVLANMHLHGIGAGRATAGVLLPVVTCCGGLGTMYGVALALALNT